MESKRIKASSRSKPYNLRTKSTTTSFRKRRTIVRAADTNYKNKALQFGGVVKAGLEAPPVKAKNLSNNNDAPANDEDDRPVLKELETGLKCAICLDTQDFEEMQPVLCGHSFHKRCFETWLQNKNFCPMCRAQVDPISIDYLWKFRFFVNNMRQWAVKAFTG